MDLYAPEAAAKPPAEQQLGPEKARFSKQYDQGSTIGGIGQQMGIDPFVWGFMNVNKDSPTTPERFEKMMASPYMAYALPRAAVVRHTEQLKTMEKQFLIEKDPARKEKIQSNYEALSGQIDILRDAIEKGPDPELISSLVEKMGITDPGQASEATKAITARWRKMQGGFAPGNAQAAQPGPEATAANPPGQGPRPAAANASPPGPAAAGGTTTGGTGFDAIVAKFLES